MGNCATPLIERGASEQLSKNFSNRLLIRAVLGSKEEETWPPQGWQGGVAESSEPRANLLNSPAAAREFSSLSGTSLQGASPPGFFHSQVTVLRLSRPG